MTDIINHITQYNYETMTMNMCINCEIIHLHIISIYDTSNGIANLLL